MPNRFGVLCRIIVYQRTEGGKIQQKRKKKRKSSLSIHYHRHFQKRGAKGGEIQRLLV